MLIDQGTKSPPEAVSLEVKVEAAPLIRGRKERSLCTNDGRRGLEKNTHPPRWSHTPSPCVGFRNGTCRERKNAKNGRRKYPKRENGSWPAWYKKRTKAVPCSNLAPAFFCILLRSRFLSPSRTRSYFNFGVELKTKKTGWVPRGSILTSSGLSPAFAVVRSCFGNFLCCLISSSFSLRL